MKLARCRWLVVQAVALLCAALAHARAPLHVLVDNSTEMPQGRFERGYLVGGIHFDVGQALAGKLGREANFRVLPRKRVIDELLHGQQADLICGYLPQWLPGVTAWSRPFLPDEQWLLSGRTVPAPRKLAELAGQRIGTVLGFVYPEMQQQLGTGFVREEAPDAGANLRKLSLGRMQHAIVGRLQFEYQMRLGGYKLDLHAPLVISSYQSQCALSRHSTVSLAELDKAIAELQAEGGIQRILAKYR
ncbi:substrate-binding periplasmic protein [Paucibacter sp. JuS9]|uniref:substrate-binding periplasmic protein n=1 Tax=Paucibacter sp. JuS9 TaxID=3228748 RepID=UPI003757EAC1